MQIVGLPGVKYGGVSRKDNWTAQGRSEYQMGIERLDGVPADKCRSGAPVAHCRQWFMLPLGADPAVWTREAVWSAAQKAEIRSDAREGRFFDIDWPRDLPTEFINGFVNDLYGPLVAMGLCVQVDWETVPAADGLPNDHLHGLVGTRVLSNAGFSPTKCRRLDLWFRNNVRRRVAGLFNAIAEGQGLTIRFDARLNAEREDSLPPEDHLPRGILRNRKSAASAGILERRDAQRGLRRKHEGAKVRANELKAEHLSLMDEARAKLDEMATLTSWQQADGSAGPLPVATAMAALMGKGVVLDRHIFLGALGAAYLVGGSAVVDQGHRILVEEPLNGDAITAMHVLARNKGWRDLSLADAFGMPIPVPPDRSLAKHRSTVSTSAVNLWQGLGKHQVVRAAATVVERWRSASMEEREDLIGRVLEWGSPQLGRLVAQLAAHGDAPSLATLGSKDLAIMMMVATNGSQDIWDVYDLEQDILAMTVPGNVLSGPFHPHPRFYEYYDLAGDRALLDVADFVEGAG